MAYRKMRRSRLRPMGYGYRKRRFKGIKLGRAVSVLAREAQKAINQKRLKQEINELTAGDVLLLPGEQAQALYDKTQSKDYGKRKAIRGYGAYSIPGVLAEGTRLGAAFASGGTMGLARKAIGDITHSTVHGGSNARPHGDWYYGPGAYTTTTNQLINPVGPSRVSKTIGDETNDMIFTYREYLKDITPTSAAFQTQYFAVVNPGLASSFPFLSQIAQFYEEYQFQQLVYEVKSVITEGNTTSQGTYCAVAQYNPLKPPFFNKRDLENYEHSVSARVTENLSMGVECDPSKSNGNLLEFVRMGPVPTGEDPKTYDKCTIQIATSGAQANLMIGELYVYYTIRLSKAKVPAIGQNPALPVLQGSATSAFGMGTLTNLNFLRGVANTNTPWINNGASYDLSVTDNNSTFTDGTPAGFYHRWTGTMTNIFFPISVNNGDYHVIISGNCAAGASQGWAYTLTNAAQIGGTSISSGSSLTTVVASMIIRVSAAGNARASISSTQMPWTGALTGASIIIRQLNPNATNDIIL